MANPNWVKGCKSGNPKGRRKGSKDFATQLLLAIKHVEGKKKKKLLVYAVERALESDKVLCALLSKIVPDLSELNLPGLKPPIFVTFESLGLRKKADDTK